MRYFELTDENTKIFFDVLEKTSIPTWIEFKVLGDNRQLDLYRVVKANEIMELLSNGINVVVILNEEIFDDLTDDMKKLVIEELLTSISVDMESGKVSIEKFDFTTYSGMLIKHGIPTMVTLKESIKSLFEAKVNKEKEEKENKKKKRKIKNKETEE